MPMTDEKERLPMGEWIAVNQRLPADRLPVNTKIHDAKGSRNEQELVRQGNLWFFPDRSMYVYYSPTHWQEIP